ncbi:MAG: RHS repeat-associated core domain-containing protein [Phycisphaerae bacterium]
MTQRSMTPGEPGPHEPLRRPAARTLLDGSGEGLCVQWLLSDGVGNTSGAVDSAGNIVLQHFDAFGVALDHGVLSSCAGPTCESCNGAAGRAAAGTAGYRGEYGYATEMSDAVRDLALRNSYPTWPSYDPVWPSGYEDRSTGLIHIGARDYEPETGRFLQADPIQIDPLPVTWGHLNRWTYCANEPVNRADLAGLATLAELEAESSLRSALDEAGLQAVRIGGHVIEKMLERRVTAGTIVSAIQCGVPYYDSLRDNIAFLYNNILVSLYPLSGYVGTTYPTTRLAAERFIEVTLFGQ